MMPGGFPARSRIESSTSLRLDEAVSALAWSPTGDLLAAASHAGEVAVVGDAGMRPVASFGVGAPVVVLRWSPRGEVLAVGMEDGNVILWREGLPQLSARPGPTVDDLAWSDDGHLAVGAGDSLVVLSTLGVAVDRCAVPAGSATALAWPGDVTSPFFAGGVGGVAEHGLALGGDPARRWVGSAVAVLAAERRTGVVAAGTIGGDVDLLFGPAGGRATVIGGRGPVQALGWSSDAGHLAVVADGGLRI